MNILQAAFLGMVQGFTEFLPISSSAHLVIFQHLIGVNASIAFDLVAHLATVLAIIVYFFQDIWELAVAFVIGNIECFKIKKTQNYVLGQHFKIGWLVIIGSIPAALMGVLFKDYFESLFVQTTAVGYFLLVTAAIILLAEWFGKNKRDEFQINFLDAVIIGIAQGFAIAPGISRSGSTVSVALLRGLKRDFAARFSFLMAIPIILGAGLFKAKDLVKATTGGIGFAPLLVGFVTAFISGWIAIKIFMEIIKRTSIRGFAYYCMVVGVCVILFLR